jgi:hypothetical protein
MKDENGLYYYPFPDNKRVRMYVQDTDGVICFRMWSADDAELWKSHGWVPFRAILEASQMSTQKHFDLKQAYDIRIARELLQDKPINQQKK